MAGYTYNNANYFIKEYRSTLKLAIKGINKNFEQMDFENADAKDKMEEHISNMIRYCNTLLNELNNIVLKK